MKHRFQRLAATLLLLSGLAPAPALGATILFNNLSSNNTIPTTTGFTIGYQVQGSDYGGPNRLEAWYAAQFTPQVSAQLTEFAVVIWGGSVGNQSVILELYDNNNGLPGSRVGTQSFAFTGSTTPGTVTRVGVSGLVVTAGVPYWLVARPGSAQTATLWGLNSPSQTPHARQSIPLVPWTRVQAPQNFFAPAFAVLGDELPSPVPEPASLALTGAGLLAAGLLRRGAASGKGRGTAAPSRVRDSGCPPAQ